MNLAAITEVISNTGTVLSLAQQLALMVSSFTASIGHVNRAIEAAPPAQQMELHQPEHAETLAFVQSLGANVPSPAQIIAAAPDVKIPASVPAAVFSDTRPPVAISESRIAELRTQAAANVQRKRAEAAVAAAAAAQKSEAELLAQFEAEADAQMTAAATLAGQPAL